MRLITVFLLCVFSFAVTLVWLFIWWHAALSNWTWGVDFNRYYEAIPEGVLFHVALVLPAVVMYYLLRMVRRGYLWKDRVFKTGFRSIHGDADQDEVTEAGNESWGFRHAG